LSQTGAGYDPLQRRALGQSGILSTQLALGTAPLGDLFQRVGEATAHETLQTGLKAGLGLVDTAPLYGAGLAEMRTGRALADSRDGARDVLVSTKVGRYYLPEAGVAPQRGWAGGLQFSPVLDYGYDGARRSLEQSLFRLGRPQVDIALIHDVDLFTHGSVDLKRSGAVRAIGVGVNEAKMCARFAHAGDFDCMLLAGQYSLLNQEALQEFFPLCEQKGIGVMLGGVFNSGILATGAVPDAKYAYAPASSSVLERTRRLQQLAAKHAIPLAAAALQFPLAHPAVSCLVVGAVLPSEVARNVASLQLPIPAAFWQELRDSDLIDPRAPLPTGV
jgi:D-threo-aldose 1-dehydrogenase